MNIKMLICTFMVGTAILSGCAPGSKLSAEEIVTKAVSADKNPISYESKGSMRVYEKGKLVEDSTFTQTFDRTNGRSRIENTSTGDHSIVVNDGKQIIMYQPEKNTAMITETPAEAGMGVMSAKDQMLKLLDLTRKTHTVENEGSEKIAGRDTYHIKLVPHKKGTIIGAMEIWIDKKTWIDLKSISESGDSKIESEITEFNDAPKFSDATFHLQLPSDVKMLPSGPTAKKVTLSDAIKALEKPFYYWNDKSLKLESIELDELKGSLNRNEVALNYTKNDTPYVSLSVFPVPKDNQEITDDSGIMETKPVNVHGQKGQYETDIRFIFWDENGLRYSLQLVHPDLKLDEALKLAEQLQLTPKE